ncbi:ATP-dependent permease [Conoideocrella luteorostrata]|uniref:ATP-dependent permease n=1 Tax=Conoideocrella luteorostrata TaxID=1105319 RepID=A0AAJ0CUC5_9HYPO|nr:ATP-dependent permease [Conoideocrella luteorostrata]
MSVPVLNDSFFNNVALGHSRPAEVSATEVRQACAFAQLESTILNLHNGQATIVGPDSHHLSGGQRQRLALARARLRDPAILVLDEPTSSLDPVSQITVMKAIREWRKDKTTIIVTHDASNIQETDFVYTMRNRLPILQEHMLERRNLAPTVQFPEDTAETRRTSLLLATTLSFSRKDRSSQLVEHWSATDHQQSIIQPTSSTARNSWCGSISKSRKRRARKSVIAGWRLTADQKGKQKQFSDYLDQHFDIYEPTYTLGKSQWDFISTSHRSSAKVLDMTEQDTTDFSGSNSTSNSNPVSPTSSIQTSIKSQGEFYDLQKQPIDSFRRVVHTVWPSLGSRDKVTLIIAFVLCLASATATPAFSFCLAQLLSAMWSKTDKVERGLRWALYLVGIAVADGLCTGVGHYLFDKVSQSWVDRLRQDAFKNVLEQPRSWFQKHRNSSRQFNERLDRNAQEMRVIVGKFLPISTVVATIMSISTIWALAICWKLALVTLSSLPLIVLVIRAYIIVNSKWAKKCNEAASSSSAVLQEVLLNFEFVRSFALETHFGTKQCTSANHTLRTGIKKALYTSPLFGLCQSITLPLTAMVFYYGTSLVSRGNGTSVSEVLQVINLLLFSIGTSFDLLDGLPQLTAAKVAATELLTYINLPRAGNTFDHMSVQPESPLPMRLFNVDFAPDQQSAKVLNRLSLDIIPGSSLAVVGPSGSGKSTLLSLLLGLSPLDRQSQSKKGNFEPIFTFAGVPYPAVDLTHLRSMMAYVPQRPFLFPATILDNIAYGISSTCTCSLQDTVVRAAKASGIHHFISSLPDGYNTLVGDGGQVLSGGQAQLINIARALARRPRLLILDEPTSALDANSALAVRVAIRSLIRSSRERSHDLAIIVATHSVEMMQMVAEVVILVGGVKVEQGQYHQLIANRGYLYRLVNHQKEQPADTALKNENASQSWKQTS